MPFRSRVGAWFSKLWRRGKPKKAQIAVAETAKPKLPPEERLESKIRGANIGDKLRLLSNKRDLLARKFRKTCAERDLDPEKTFTVFYEKLVLHNDGEMRLWVGEVEAKVKDEINKRVGLYRAKKIDRKRLMNEVNLLHLRQVRDYARIFTGLIIQNHPDIVPLLSSVKASQ